MRIQFVSDHKWTVNTQGLRLLCKATNTMTEWPSTTKITVHRLTVHYKGESESMNYKAVHERDAMYDKIVAALETYNRPTTPEPQP